MLRASILVSAMSLVFCASPTPAPQANGARTRPKHCDEKRPPPTGVRTWSLEDAAGDPSVTVQDAGVVQAPDGGATGDGGAAEDGGARRRGLTAEQIRRGVIAHQGALRACYEIEAQCDWTIRGQVKLSWTIAPSGVVTRASIASSTIGNQRVEECVLRQATRWRFPASDGTSNVTFPLRFASE